jgi:hypothetical protein
MTTEEYLAEMNGKIEALTLACSTLITLSTDKKQISKMLTSIVRAAESEQSEALHQKNYTNGIKSVISTLEESLSCAEFAAMPTVQTFGKHH